MKVKLPEFMPVKVLILLILLLGGLWVALLVVSITLTLLSPNTMFLLLLLIPTHLIVLYALMHLVSLLGGLYVVYTKTTKAHGLEQATVFGGEELSTYETLKTEVSIMKLSELARLGGNMDHE
jgi:membrane protein implicated in regulation of membrane protease activity